MKYFLRMICANIEGRFSSTQLKEFITTEFFK